MLIKAALLFIWLNKNEREKSKTEQVRNKTANMEDKTVISTGKLMLVNTALL